MKKTAHFSTKKPSVSSFLKNRPTLWGIGIVTGIILTMGISYINASTTGVLYGCVREHIGLLRVVSQGQKCLPQERQISWNIQGPPGPVGPSGAPGQSANQGVGVGSFLSTDLSGYISSGEYFNYRNFDGVNFTDASLQWTDFTKSSLAGTNFTNAKLDNVKFIRTNAKNANFTGATISYSVADKNSNFFDGVIFENADFSNAVLKGIDLSKGTVTGAKWSNTTCPDGSNSDTHDNTCEGHLSQ